MTAKQFILKALYPLLMKYRRLKRKNTGVISNQKHIPPVQTIYDLTIPLNSGQTLPVDKLRGKKILFVNTASNCGFTAQYAELQELYEKYNSKLEIIGFPANDFKEQEKGSDDEIATFCQVNFGVKFPLAKKSTVVKSEGQNNIFNWLTHKSRNGWNDRQPKWNFSKYLIDESGTLTHYFDPSVSPLSEDVQKAVDDFVFPSNFAK